MLDSEYLAFILLFLLENLLKQLIGINEDYFSADRISDLFQLNKINELVLDITILIC